MWTTCATATDDKLTTLENVKEALAITDSLTDQFLDRQILRASRRIQSYLGRPLLLQTYQAVLPSYGGVNLLLPFCPVVAVDRVIDGTDTGTGGDGIELAATEYRVDHAGGFLNRDYGWRWTRQIQHGSIGDVPQVDGEYHNWLVEFSAGYIGPNGTSSTGHYNTSTGPTLPADIEDACIELVKSAYHARSRSDDIASESVGDVSVSYRGPSMGSGSRALPQTVKEYLEPYRSMVG
jgi:hypothetical protein